MTLLDEATEPLGLDTGGMRDFHRRRGPPGALQFLAGGRRVAIIGFGGFLEIWDTVSGFPVTLCRIDGRPGGVNAFDASPNGDRLLLGTRDAGLQLLDLKGRELARLSLPKAAADYFSIEPSGVTSSPGGSDDGEARTNPPYRTPTDFAFAPGGHSAIAAYGQGYALTWDLRTGQLRRALGREAADGASARIYRVAWSPDGRQIVTYEAGGCLRLLDPDSGRLLKTLESRKEPEFQDRLVAIPAPVGLGGGIGAVRFSSDSRYLVAGAGEWLRLWDLWTNRELPSWRAHTPFHPIMGAGRPVPGVVAIRAAAAAPRILTVGADAALRVWEIPSGRCLWEAIPAPCCLDLADLSPDGKHVAWAGCPGARVYRL